MPGLTALKLGQSDVANELECAVWRVRPRDAVVHELDDLPVREEGLDLVRIGKVKWEKDETFGCANGNHAQIVARNQRNQCRIRDNRRSGA